LENAEEEVQDEVTLVPICGLLKSTLAITIKPRVMLEE
jgi:hypothetical protein